MSEYNIQMNKYNALNAEYDQLYPQPMKHANTHAKNGNDPITPSMIGTYTQTQIDTLLQNKADASSVYTKEESISASTRTALSLAETATPDAALAEIARQLSESMVLLWENPSPTSDFPSQTIRIDLSQYKAVIIKTVFNINYGNFGPNAGADHNDIIVVGEVGSIYSPSSQIRYREVSVTTTGCEFTTGYAAGTYNNTPSETVWDCIPVRIYGIK